MNVFEVVPMVEIGPGGSPPPPPTNGTVGYANGTGEAPPAGCLGGPGFLIMWGAIIVGMWLLLIRPQRKREREVREMQAALEVGENIITTSGFYGKIVGKSTDAFLVEFGENRGLRVWVRKSDIAGPKTPSTTLTSSSSDDKKEDKKDAKEDKKKDKEKD